jgi:hypothetical protein
MREYSFHASLSKRLCASLNTGNCMSLKLAKLGKLARANWATFTAKLAHLGCKLASTLFASSS